MARAKKRRYADGGDIEAEEIVVQGKRPLMEREVSAFDLARVGSGSGGFSGLDMASMMGGGAGGGMGNASQRMPNLSYNAPKADRSPVVPAVVRSASSELADLAGMKPPPGYGLKFRSDFAKGGKAKAKPVKKMAKGGSTASKRADGCATKGKTKGRFV